MRRLFLVETGLRFDQFSAVALPAKVEPSDDGDGDGDGKGTGINRSLGVLSI
jgi:hypothetical protein